MPFHLRTEGFRDNPRRFAFLNGPLVLSAEVDPARPLPAVVTERGPGARQPQAGRGPTLHVHGPARTSSAFVGQDADGQ